MAALLPLTLLAAVVQATTFTPTAPGPGEIFRAGSNCTIEWVPDTTGTWKNVSIDLMSGTNLEMYVVKNVARGLDGTDASLTPFNWTCPEVNPYAPIYFYQFTEVGDEADPQWTARFTIADANGTSVPAPHALQPSGEATPWGIGVVVNATNSTTNATSPPVIQLASPTNATSTALPSSTACGFATLRRPVPTGVSLEIPVKGFANINESHVIANEEFEPLPRAVVAAQQLSSGGRRRVDWENVGLACLAWLAVMQFMMLMWD